MNELNELANELTAEGRLELNELHELANELTAEGRLELNVPSLPDRLLGKELVDGYLA